MSEIQNRQESRIRWQLVLDQRSWGWNQMKNRVSQRNASMRQQPKTHMLLFTSIGQHIDEVTITSPRCCETPKWYSCRCQTTQLRKSVLLTYIGQQMRLPLRMRYLSGLHFTDCHYNNNPISQSQGQSPFGCILPDGEQAFCIETSGLLLASYFSKKTSRQLYNSISSKSKKRQSHLNWAVIEHRRSKSAKIAKGWEGR
jgi:hypothetical protein